MSSHADALAHLTDADPILGDVIARVGPYRMEPAAEGTHFGALLRSIVYQQLSGKAAGTIHGRFLALYGGQPTPAQLLDTPDETLRAAGLSRQKVVYMQDLARHVEEGRLPLDAIAQLNDDELIRALVAVKGIGRWTAQVFMMFRLGRPDVLPELDLGVQKAVMRAYRLPEMPKPKALMAMGEKWRPYRSIASWYWWRSLELEPLD
jgi:3-methyladenine DNA glycosylase/8-oxoguanine DNA glycosylase